jgi:hypothetical protein
MASCYKLAPAGIYRKRMTRQTLRIVFEFGTGIELLNP